jgi:hypothetical protein
MKFQKFTRTVLLLVITFLVAILVLSIVVNQKHWNITKNITSNNQNLSPKTKAMLSKLPLTFIENQGQWNTKAQFFAKKRDMSILFEKDGFVLNRKKSDDNQVKTEAIRMIFEGASEQVTLKGAQEQTAKYNFFIGNDQSKWRNNITGYTQLIYHNLYQGIDLCFYEKNNVLEYDLMLSPGADLNDIKIRCAGLKDLRIDENGILVMETEFGPITQSLPKAWYKQAYDENLPAVCNFRIIDKNTYGFQMLESNSQLALVIDPGLEWATFLGGNADDHCMSVTLTTDGNIIVAGVTGSNDFPFTPGAYDTTFNGGQNDGIISCLSPDGTQLFWSTFLGGIYEDVLFEVCVDSAGRVMVGGSTCSPNFPTTPSAYDTSYNEGWDGIIACLNQDGSQLLFSTYLGTDLDDMIVALDVANSGDVVVSGYTGSRDFPTTAGAYDITYNGGVRDAFVTHISADGSTLVYSTFLGGSGDDGYTYQYPLILNSDVMSVLLDNEGNVIITGVTGSWDFPTTANAYDTTWNGGMWDIFVTKLDATSSNLIFSTFLGGESWEGSWGDALCLGENGVIAIGGSTQSSDFPTTFNAFDTTFNGGPNDWDAFIVLLDSTGSQLLYSTFIGGTDTLVGDVVTSMAFEADGNILFAGQAEYGFPFTSGAYDTIFDGYYDAFIARLSPDGNGQADLIYCSYIGSSTVDLGCDLATVDNSTVVLIGLTDGYDFPITSGAYDESYNGGLVDGFILRFAPYPGIHELPITILKSSITLSPVYPNPVHKQFCYELNLKQATKVKVSLFDIAGRIIETLVDKQLSTGTHNFTCVPKQKLANGIYYLRLDTEYEQQSRKFIVMK